MTHIVRMEWHKLRTVRSTWWIITLFMASLTGLALLILSHENYPHLSATDRAAFDPVHDTYIGLVLVQLLTGTLGVLTITTEFSSGLIRATFAAAPKRAQVLAAKAAVLGAVTLIAGELAAFAAFALGQSALKSPAPHATLTQPGVLRAVLLAGAYPALIALIGLGLGALVRHTAGAICALVGLLFVLPLLFITPSLANTSQNFLLHPMANAMTAVKPLAHTWPAAPLFALLCTYALAILGAGTWALTHRDA